MSQYPEVKPIRVTDVVLYELAPDGKWTPVPRAGERLTVGLRPLTVFEVREVQQLEDAEPRFDLILKHAVKSVQVGAELLDLAAIPYLHYTTLAGVAFQRSCTGADPFFVAPAAS